LYFDEGVEQTQYGEISLCIKNATLAELKVNKHTYTALSYAWGSGPDDKIVKIDGLDFSVTSNLESALRNICFVKGDGFLWIDAICINQSDIPEKNGQVTMMAEIYATASLTLVWLGECNSAISDAIDMLEAARVFNDGTGAPAIDLDHTIGEFRYIFAWKGVGELLAAPWWRRMWVIQEITLGQRAMILCGTKMLMFQRLAMGADVAFRERSLSHIFPVCKNGFTNYWRVHTMMRYRMRRQQDEPLLLPELLENNVSSEASNPRDMVFALVGLATDTNSAPELVIDYNMPVEDVYTNVVKFHIRQYKSLDMICHSAHPRKHQNLPSWVPDFLNLKETTAEPLATLSKSWPGNPYWYHASGTHTSNDSALTDSHAGILCVSAIFVDKISHIGPECWPGDFSGLSNCLDIWRNIVHQAIGLEREYICGGSVIDAFNRTLCGDRKRSGLRATKGWRGYEALVSGMEIPGDFRLGSEVPEQVRREAWVGDALQAVALRSHRRQLITTEMGYIGLGPPRVKEGDFISILLGASVPVVLRQKGDKWWVVGESFVCGIMDGEVLGMTDMPSKETEEEIEKEKKAEEATRPENEKTKGDSARHTCSSKDESASKRFRIEEILLV
jgi:hypothetical protein